MLIIDFYTWNHQLYLYTYIVLHVIHVCSVYTTHELYIENVSVMSMLIHQYENEMKLKL